VQLLALIYYIIYLYVLSGIEARITESNKMYNECLPALFYITNDYKIEYEICFANSFPLVKNPAD